MENEQQDKLQIKRHSLSHILAMAVLEMFPEAKLGIGPAIETGFYYDFELPRTLIPEDLPILEEKIQKIIEENLPFEKGEMGVDEASDTFKKIGQEYKTELIHDLKTKEHIKKVSIYRTGHFSDLCSGPHIDSTGEIDKKSFKLDRVSGAYWKGDEKNKMLQRVYGLAFETAKELEDYLKMREEAEKRDHRKLGKELELFIIDPSVGMGLPLWLPKGAMLWRIIEDFWYKEHLKNDYELVRSPHIGSRKLWETSGHWGFYSDSMYPPIEVGKSLEESQEEKTSDKKSEEYLIKPMNCPFHTILFKSKPYSYKNLPIRWAEAGTVYRYEKSGELSGLTRVRGFTQDDAHIICAKEQVEEELARVIDFIKFMLGTFGFKEYKVYLSLRDPKNTKKYSGHSEGWEFTQNVLEKVAKEKGLDYTKEEGEAAFYGPKLDFKIKDVLGRQWQCSTLQFDFNLPERFGMEFTNEKGEKERPYMLHRALFGSFERFIGVLTEHFAGAFPVWLSPEQVHILPVSEKYKNYAQKIANLMREKEIRVKIKDEDETLGKRIRESEKSKVPYMLIVGEKEVEGGSVSVRHRIEGDLGAIKTEEFIERILEEIKEKI
ncbi:MAG: threonine--tRNA ligase [bacterium]